MSSVGLSSSSLASLLGSSTTSSNAIDLSSLLEVATGSSSEGINVSAAVDAAVTAAEAPEQQWQAQQTALQAQENDLTTVNGQVTTLENDLTSLNSLNGAFASLSTTSSNSSIATATATSGTAAGSHTVSVTNLAATASWYSTSAVASSSSGLAAGSFTLQVGSGTATQIDVTSGETLDQLVSAINGQSLGVTASVVNDASGSRLSIVSNSSGSANDIAITSTSMQFTQAMQGKNAALTVDGIPISSATNTVTGAVAGMTINLNGAAPGTAVTLSASANTSAITSAINQFVSDYNTVIGSVNTEYTYSSTSSTSGPLEGDSTLGLLQNALLGAGSYSASNNGAISTLGSLGITMNNDGTLTVDSSTLNDAVQNNFSAVQNFFEGSSLNGFSSALNTQLQGLTDAADGAFTVDLSSMKNTYKDLQGQITDFQTNYIAPLQTSLTAEYNAAEIALQTLNTTKQEINAELGNNNNSSSGN